ncbi:MAG: fatty acid desaturase [Armatimonadota bacterium]
MSLEIMRDPRVRSVEWHDLLELSAWDITKELLLIFPWLIASLTLAYYGQYLIALPFSFIFFLCGLRVVHNAYHYALGIPRLATEWVMFIISCLMMSSMHALQQTHLHHHAHCMDDDDAEAASAHLKGWQAIAYGPRFYWLIHRKGIELANPRQMRWIQAEFVTVLAWAGVALFALDIAILKYHVLAMLIGQCLTAFFAVWTVHHDCDRHHFIARTIRNPIKSLIVFDMFYHLEHHLYPKVPTCKLSKLAKRLDQAAPELSQKQVY